MVDGYTQPDGRMLEYVQGDVVSLEREMGRESRSGRGTETGAVLGEAPSDRIVCDGGRGNAEEGW